MEILDVKASSGNHKWQERTFIFKSVTELEYRTLYNP